MKIATLPFKSGDLQGNISGQCTCPADKEKDRSRKKIRNNRQKENQERDDITLNQN